MASAKRIDSGAYRCQVSKVIDGKKVRKSFVVNPKDCGGDWKQAKKKAEQLANEWQLMADIEAHMTTVKKAFDVHLESRKDVWSPSTYKDFANMPKHFEDIWDMDINDVDSKVIQSQISKYMLNSLSSKTITNRINFLIAALSTSGIEKRFKYKIPKTVKPELLPPEPTEFERLLSMADDELKLVIILAGLYTLRRGEIGGLYGEDILWDMNKIYIHTSMVKDVNKQWVRKPIPKNLSSVRTINIEPQIMKLFPKVGPKEPLIKMTPDAMTHSFERLRKKACVDCRLHDLRKYAASIRSDIMPGKYIEADGGWSKESNVMSTIYDKPFKEKRKEYAKKLNQKIIDDYGEALFGG